MAVLLVFIVLSAVVAIATVATTVITGEMSEAALSGDTAALLQFLGFIAALMAVRAACAALSALLLGRFAAKAGYRFRDNFARYFLRLPFAQLEKEQSGASLSVYTNDLPGAMTFVSHGGMQMIADFIVLIVTIVYMFTIHVWFSLLFFGMFPVLVVMQTLISGPIQRKSIKMSEEQANFNAIVNDSLQNLSTIAAYSLEDVLKRRYMDAYDKFFEAVRDMIKSMCTMVIVGIGASIAPMLIIFAVAAASVINGGMSVAEFVVYTALAFEAGVWLTMLSQRLTNVQVAAAGAKRLNGHTEELETLDLEVDRPGVLLQPLGDIAVNFKDVDFTYGSDGSEPPADSYEVIPTNKTPADTAIEEQTEPAMALSQINLTIKKGEKIAFVGGSGSGKSTLLKLMLGLYIPTAGTVTVFGQEVSSQTGISSNITAFDPSNAFAYVPQDSFLFPESIGENITNTTTPDTSKLETACRDAGIWDFINSLPDKFDGILAESAENVSGGQKQRIALARAFYQDAPIILFDEATSALDPTTEADVLKSFENMLSHDAGKTVIMVAHRPKAIAFCDTIVLMENGKIVATSSHEELLASCPQYANLEV